MKAAVYAAVSVAAALVVEIVTTEEWRAVV
jgi:hypothetical protein